VSEFPDFSPTRRRSRCLVCGGDERESFCAAVDRVQERPGETWQIVRCRKCGFGWTEPLLSADELGAYYPGHYLGEVERRIDEYLSGRLQRSRSWKGEVEKVRLVERYVPGGRILDVGCGDGKFLWALAPERWERFGVERSVEAVTLLRQRMPGLNLVAGDIHSAELIPGRFDALTFWHVLEHLPDPEAALARAAMLLRPGGWILVSLPCMDSLQALLFRGCWYGFDDVPRHLHHFSGKSLVMLLTRTGFIVRRELMFSRNINFHALKHSLLNWCTETRQGRARYYALKPALFGFQLLERMTGRSGIRGVIARKLS
jgi:SAM-dependent methyltransferase